MNLAEACWLANHCGIIICIKPGMAEKVIKLIKRIGRGRQLRVVRHGGGERFRPMDWGIWFGSRHQDGIPVRSATGVMDTLLEVYHRGRLDTKQDQFFGAASENLMHLTMRLVVRSTGKCDLSEVMKCIESLPHRREEFEMPDEHRIVRHLEKVGDEVEWSAYRHHASLAPETSTSIEVSATTRGRPLQEEPIKSLFFGEASTIYPEMIDRENLLVVIDFPTETHGAAGKAIAATFLECCQRYAMSRNEEDDSVRPFGAWLDEGMDVALESTISACEKGRSCKFYTVWTCQTLASIEKGFGGDKTKAEALRGAIGTFMFFRNVDHPTREFAEKMAGKRLKWRRQFSHVVEDMGQVGYSEQEAPALPEKDMLGIKTSAEEDFAECYIIDGRRWRWNGQHHILMRWYVPGTKWRWWHDWLIGRVAARQWSQFPAWYRWAWDRYEKIRRGYLRLREVFNGNPSPPSVSVGACSSGERVFCLGSSRTIE